MLASFRRFRHSRPFWAGLFTIAAGIEILLLPISPIADLVLLGVAGMSGALIGVVLVVTGVFIWFSPPNRTLAGVLTLVFSLGSFVVSNLGGLIVGMVLGLIGGGLALAWTPDKAAAKAAAKERPGRRIGPPWRRGGPPAGPAAGIALLVGLLPMLLLAGGGRAEALPAPPIPSPPPVPTPGSGSGGVGPLLGMPTLPGAPGLVVPPIVPGLTALLPPALFAPFQPTVAPERNVVTSGLVGELLMDSLTVTNFRYQGMIDFPVAGGGHQRALRIIVDSTDIGNLRINIPSKDSSVQVTQGASAKHARTTRLILDCTRVRLTIGGVLTIEFSLDFPPPPLIVIPFLPVTDVQIDYVRLSTPTLIIPEIEVKADGRPGGKRVGLSGTGMNQSAPPGLRAGSALSPAQITQLTSLAAVLHRPELLRPYLSARP